MKYLLVLLSVVGSDCKARANFINNPDREFCLSAFQVISVIFWYLRWQPSAFATEGFSQFPSSSLQVETVWKFKKSFFFF